MEQVWMMKIWFDIVLLCEFSYNKFTPIQLAALNGELEVFKYLLEKGADVNSKDQIQ